MFAEGHGFHQQEGLPIPFIDGRRPASESDEIEGPSEGGASLPDTEEDFWLQQGALSGSGEERNAAVCGVRPGQPVHGTEKVAEGYIGALCPEEAKGNENDAEMG